MNQRSESSWSFPSAASKFSKIDEKLVTQHLYYHSQYGLKVTAMPTSDDCFPRFADHTYREYSTYIERGGAIDKHKKSDRNFPARLHAMLSDEQYSHIISWMPHGRAWKVINKELLMEEAIPKFFGQSKFASFSRQLSGWGFTRLHKAGRDFGCYYHECFLRGHPRLTVLMRRVSPGQGKAAPNIYAEPYFYLIAKRHPLEKSANVPDKEEINEASKYEDTDVPLAAKEAAAPDMKESISTHQWDPYDQQNAAHPTREAAALSCYDSSIHFSKVSSQSDSFAGVDVNRGDDKKEDKYQEAIKYDPFSVSYHHLDPQGYSMHQAHHEAVMSRYYGSMAAAGHYYPKPHRSHLHDDDMFPYDYRYNNPYSCYSNYHSAQGLAQAQGYAQAQGANTAIQPHYPAQGACNHNLPLPLPEFSQLEHGQELKSVFNEDEKESDSKPQA